MFIFLSKFLPLFIYPVGLSTLLILLGLLFFRKQNVSRLAFFLAFLVLVICGNRWISYILARSLEWQYLPDSTATHSADAIVVLGGGTESALPPRSSVELNSAGDRLIHAAEIYKSGAAPVLLLSGGKIEWMESIEDSPASDMKDIIQKLGIPDQALILQPKSRNTYEDAVFSAEILKGKGAKRIILVTSAMHMPRSVALFKKQGLEVIPAPTDYTITEDGWTRVFSPNLETFLTNLLPNSSSLGLTTSVLKEYIGYVVYYLRGWL
ncbi:MAG: YdcF family protein [Leptolinea sp.]|nr:YdcF family protein [Leptolinea sp.]